MVARIATGKSIRSILLYNERKVLAGQAELLLAAGFCQEPSDLELTAKLSRIKRQAAKSPNVKTHAVHISLNFSPLEQLVPDTLVLVATAYMQRIGFGEQPYLVYRHVDAGHPHLHIVSTNIRPDGKRINLHNIGRDKSEPARKALEIEFGLVRAENRGRQQVPVPYRLEKACYGTEETRKGIARVVSAVLARYNCTSLPELNAALRYWGVSADRGKEGSPMHRRKGLTYSLLDRDGQRRGIPLKASALPGRPTLTTLEKVFDRNKALQAQHLVMIRQQVDLALLSAQREGKQAFIQQLNQAGIQVLFRENTQDLTYLDHHNGAVMSGSELGKAYSARGLSTRLALHGKIPATGKGEQPWEAKTTNPGNWHTGAAMGQGPTAGPELLRELLEAQQQCDYLPGELKRRKRKKRKQNLTT